MMALWIEASLSWRKIHGRDNRWKVLSFSRNFGHQTAVSAGIHYNSENCVVVIDADLQDPPELIPDLVAKWQEGYQVVYAVRKKRKEGIVKNSAMQHSTDFWPAARTFQFPWIPGFLSDGPGGCGEDKIYAGVEPLYQGTACLGWFSSDRGGDERDARAAGKPSYTWRKLIHLAFDGIFPFDHAFTDDDGVRACNISFSFLLRCIILFNGFLPIFSCSTISSWSPDLPPP